MFQKECCQPRDTATLLFNGNKISTRLAILKLLVATIFSLLILGKKTLTSSHPLQGTEYVGSVLAAGIWTQSGKVEFSKALQLKAFVEHTVPILDLFILDLQVHRSADHWIKQKEESIFCPGFRFAGIHPDCVADFSIDEDSAEV